MPVIWCPTCRRLEDIPLGARECDPCADAFAKRGRELAELRAKKAAEKVTGV